METNGQDMMLKLKESFSQKSFSSASYHSSLICNSKTIRLEVNLINGAVLTSAKTSSSSNFTAISCRNVLKNNQEAAGRHDQNSQTSRGKIESVELSSAMKKSPTKEKINTKNSLRFSSEKRKSKLKSSVQHKADNHKSSDQIQTKAKETRTDFESFRCDVCMKYFSSKRNVKRHSILHSMERHPCKTCAKVFQTKENLKRHCRTMHEIKVKSIKCSKCYKAFSRKTDLDIHLKKHPDHVQISSFTESSTSDLLL